MALGSTLAAGSSVQLKIHLAFDQISFPTSDAAPLAHSLASTVRAEVAVANAIGSTRSLHGSLSTHYRIHRRGLFQKEKVRTRNLRRLKYKIRGREIPHPNSRTASHYNPPPETGTSAVMLLA